MLEGLTEHHSSSSLVEISITGMFPRKLSNDDIYWPFLSET